MFQGEAVGWIFLDNIMKSGQAGQKDWKYDPTLKLEDEIKYFHPEEEKKAKKENWGHGRRQKFLKQSSFRKYKSCGFCHMIQTLVVIEMVIVLILEQFLSWVCSKYYPLINSGKYANLLTLPLHMESF